MSDKLISSPPSQEDKLWAAASYLWIISLIALAARKDNAYIRFHANQGALLALIWTISMIIPGVGWLLGLVVAVAALVGLVKALSGERWPLPLIAPTAEKFGDWIITTFKL